VERTLDQTLIIADRYFLSPRVMALKSILGRLEPQKPAPPPLPPMQFFAPPRATAKQRRARS
jgi:hypothetical protein